MEAIKKILTKAMHQGMPFLARHKVSLILAGVIVVMLYRSMRIPHVSVESPTVKSPTVKSPAVESPAVSPAPAASPGSTQPQLAPVLSITPGEEGADPKWSLPANLSSSEVQSFVRQIDLISDTTAKLVDAQQHYTKQMDRLLDKNVVDLMWPRLKGGGFKDQKLPSDWYEIVKDKDGTTGGELETTGGIMAQMAVLIPMSLRIPGMRVRAIGGRALVGDVLFLKAFQSYVDERNAYYQKLNGVVDGVVSRMEDEFPVEFGHRQPNLSPQQAFALAQQEFSGPGFKSLKIAMNFDDLASMNYMVLSEETAVRNYHNVRMQGDRWSKIGSYPLDGVTAFFADGQLCNIKIEISQNGDEIFRLFQQRYNNQIHWEHKAVDGNTTRATAIADYPGDDGYAAISGTTSGTNNTVTWDRIEFGTAPDSYRRIFKFLR